MIILLYFYFVRWATQRTGASLWGFFSEKETPTKKTRMKIKMEVNSILIFDYNIKVNSNSIFDYDIEVNYDFSSNF